MNSVNGRQCRSAFALKIWRLEAVSRPLGTEPADLHHGKLDGETQCLQRAHTEWKGLSSGSLFRSLVFPRHSDGVWHMSGPWATVVA